jgi:hypothetical protein
MATKDNAVVAQDETNVKSVASYMAAAAGSVMIAGNEFEIAQQVTVPVLKHESGETIAVTLVAPILAEDQFDTKIDEETGEVLSQKFKGKINVGRVTELSTGQLFQYVFNAISASELRNAYPSDGYVGKSFLIKKLGVVAGRRYKDVQILELKPKAA